MSRAPDGSTGEQFPNASRGEDRRSSARSLDTIFGLLESERRRKALYVLYQRAEAVSVTDLAAEVASLEGGDPERVTAALYHVHLPKLAAAEVVEFDADAGRVRLAASSDRFRRYLTGAAADEGRALRRASASATLSEF